MAIEMVKPGIAVAVALPVVANMGWEEVGMKVDEHGGRRSSFLWRIGVRLATACIVSYVCAS